MLFEESKHKRTQIEDEVYGYPIKITKHSQVDTSSLHWPEAGQRSVWWDLSFVVSIFSEILKLWFSTDWKLVWLIGSTIALAKIGKWAHRSNVALLSFAQRETQGLMWWILYIMLVYSVRWVSLAYWGYSLPLFCRTKKAMFKDMLASLMTANLGLQVAGWGGLWSLKRGGCVGPAESNYW